MHLQPLLLAMATPVAASTMKSIGALATHARESFAQVLEGGKSTESTSRDLHSIDTPQKKQSVAEQLESVARQLREWLSEHGLHRPFELNLNVDAGGKEQLDVAGEESPRVLELVSQRPDLRSQLSALAVSLQALTGGLGTGAVNLMISDQSSSSRSI